MERVEDHITRGSSSDVCCGVGLEIRNQVERYVSPAKTTWLTLEKGPRRA